MQEPFKPPVDVQRLGEHARLVVLGGGATTAANRLADQFVAAFGQCHAIVADPADAQIGPPTAVVLAVREGGQWVVQALEGLATLDGARFRGPVSVAVARLVRRVSHGPLLVLAPGLVRGVAAFELPSLLACACGATGILVSGAKGRTKLLAALRATSVPVHWLDEGAGTRPSDNRKKEARQERWIRFVANAQPFSLDLDAIDVLGIAPPRDVPVAWQRRVVALLDGAGNTVALGRIETAIDGVLRGTASRVGEGDARAVCVRDAMVDEDGGPVTGEAPTGLAAEETRRARERSPGRAFDLPLMDAQEPALSIPPLGHKGEVVCDLVNGVFGDPLLHVRVVGTRRSLLFDIGEAVRLPRRIAHQVTDVFVSHAHMDHVAGLVWLVRMRMGEHGPCHVVGPPGLARQVASQLGVFTWNLLERSGPRFVVDEVHGAWIRRYDLEAGASGMPSAQTHPLHDGVVMSDPQGRVRAATVDHNTPVLAYRFEQASSWHVRSERLDALGLRAGPWLGELKRAAEGEALDGLIALPDGRNVERRTLASDLLAAVPGEVLSYVTDVADHARNFAVLEPLVDGSDILVCEAGFLEEDMERARAAAHLTTQACARLARNARVRVLVPFHFSARYEGEEERVYEEIRRGFGGRVVEVPRRT